MSQVERPRLVIGVGDGVVQPKAPLEADISPPDEKLRLKSVFGYNGEMLHNLAYNTKGDFVYAAASVGVIQTREGNQIFHTGHNLNISAIAIDSKRRLVATGEVEDVNRPPLIRIWDSESGKLICEVPSELNHSNSSFGHLLIGRIKSLAFSPDSTQLVAVGDDTNHSITLLKSRFRWTSYKRIFHHTSTRSDVNFVQWKDNNTFYTGGDNHIYLWDINKQEYKICKFGHCPVDNMLCAIVINDLLVCGTSSGNIITFKNDTVFRYKKIHKLCVSSLCKFNDGYISSGDDKSIIYWSNEGKPLYGWDLVQMLPLINKSIEGYRLGKITSLSTYNTNIAIGDCFGNIYEVVIIGKKLTTCTLVLHQGQNKRILGACLPSPLNKDFFVTTCSDRSIFFWDVNNRMPLKIIKLEFNVTSICYHPNKPILCCAIEPHDAPSLNDPETIEELSNFILIDLTNYTTIYKSGGLTNAEIHLMRFSPNGKTLVLCCQDKTIFTYDLSTPQIKIYGEYHDAEHLVDYLDYSNDNRVIKFQCNDELNTIFYLLAEHCKPIVLASEISKLVWATTTCLKSWDVKGLFNIKKGINLSSLKLCTSNKQKTLLLCIDKKSNIKLYKYPVIDESSMYKTFIGQTTMIESGSFLSGGLGVLTYSKLEGSIFVWEFVK